MGRFRLFDCGSANDCSRRIRVRAKLTGEVRLNDGKFGNFRRSAWRRSFRPHRQPAPAAQDSPPFRSARLVGPNKCWPAMRLGGRQASVWRTRDDRINSLNPVARERLGYPTQKPLSLLERIIQQSSNERMTVLDPFCGCGLNTHPSRRCSYAANLVIPEMTYARIERKTRKSSSRTS